PAAPDPDGDDARHRERSGEGSDGVAGPASRPKSFAAGVPERGEAAETAGDPGEGRGAGVITPFSRDPKGSAGANALPFGSRLNGGAAVDADGLPRDEPRGGARQPHRRGGHVLRQAPHAERRFAAPPF